MTWRGAIGALHLAAFLFLAACSSAPEAPPGGEAASKAAYAAGERYAKALKRGIDRGRHDRATADLENARRALEQVPAAERRLELHLTAPTPGQVQLTVRDHGPGIPPEARERLFEPFFTTRAGGLGLGLPLHFKEHFGQRCLLGHDPQHPVLEGHGDSRLGWLRRRRRRRFDVLCRSHASRYYAAVSRRFRDPRHRRGAHRGPVNPSQYRRHCQHQYDEHNSATLWIHAYPRPNLKLEYNTQGVNCCLTLLLTLSMMHTGAFKATDRCV